jgi:hypothetical protein
LIADTFDEEQEAFQDAVRYAGTAWMLANRLRLRALNEEQRRATSNLVTTLARFTLSLRSEFARQPQTKNDTEERPQPAQGPIGPARSRVENPYDAVVKAVGHVWAGLCDLLSMPNRLSDEQRNLAGDVLTAIDDFTRIDFCTAIRMSEPEAA